jgi:hypothetical protein
MTKASRIREGILAHDTATPGSGLCGRPSETHTVVAEQMHDRASRPVFETTLTGVWVPETLLW